VELNPKIIDFELNASKWLLNKMPYNETLLKSHNQLPKPSITPNWRKKIVSI